MSNPSTSKKMKIAEASQIKSCAVCGSDKIVAESGNRAFTIGPKKAAISVLISWDRCTNCGSEYLHSEAQQIIQDARIKSFGLLTPSELLEIRTTLGLSQNSWTRKLGIGEKSYTRWETGRSIQTKAMDNLIRLKARELAAKSSTIPEGPVQKVSYSEIKKQFMYVSEQAFRLHESLCKLNTDEGFLLPMIPRTKAA